MKKSSFFFLFVAGGLVVFAESPGDIPTPQKRAAMVGLAKGIITSQSALVEPINAATLKNPFSPAEASPQQSVSMAPTTSSGPAVVTQTTDFSRLELIAPKVTPTGSVVIGGESLLLFGQKRLKVGDHLPIVFEGKPYDLEISGIQSTNFTLRLNGVEITRPIKSVKKP